ncbi:MAG: hypothetical protein EH224_03110 [Calditrichaeota bacterium]|nr:MAG: hypothetical protein EH224_03110 [Calditrichota bacterium]
MINNSRRKIKLNEEEAYQNQKIKILNEIENDIIKRLKNRFAIPSIIGSIGIVFLSIFGIRLLVDGIIQDKYADAMRSAVKAENAASDAQKLHDILKKNYQLTIDTLKDKTNILKSKQTNLQNDLEAKSSYAIEVAKFEVKNLTDRLIKLEKLVSELSINSNRIKIDEFQKELNDYVANLKKERELFYDNSKYNINLIAPEEFFNSKISWTLYDAIQSSGFKIFKTESTYSKLLNNAITIYYPPNSMDKVKILMNLINYNYKDINRIWDIKLREIVDTNHLSENRIEIKFYE